MVSDKQKTVVIGISGCIAAYKACEIVRGLQKEDIRVKVVMTEHATHFVDPLTFRALTNEPVAINLFDNPQDPIHHVSLAQEADLLLLAPCTANLLAKTAHGLADDLLSTIILATTAPILIAPAMNVHMYENTATQANITALKHRGFEFVDADEGYLACGEVGKGRLADPDIIVAAVLNKLDQVENPVRSDLTTTLNATPTQRIPIVQKPKEDSVSIQKPQHAAIAPQPFTQQTAIMRALDLAGKNIMVTAGPTVEPIDPVRYLTNRSSGKFGYAIAQAAAERGANVTLISGPVALAAPRSVKVIYIETAQELLETARSVFDKSDIALFAAAVADMRPEKPADKKLKKEVDTDSLSSITLTENPDVLATLASKKTHQIVVGFAAETDNVVEYAKKKLTSKHADMIVANEVGEGKAFDKDDNEIWLVTSEGTEKVEKASKSKLADVILTKTLEL